MRKNKIAIMGGPASFHEQAALQWGGAEHSEIISKGTFVSALKAVSENEADYCVIAIENSIAGSILPNYVLVNESGLRIIAEIFLPVELHLMVHPETSEDEIRAIKSHPMALYQCSGFLSRCRNISVVETADTVAAALLVAQGNERNLAAIAGRQAAEKFGLKILHRNIESCKNNYTRFWILSKGGIMEEKATRATVCFLLDDVPGALAKVLNVFSRSLINLSRVQSVPLPDQPGIFRFYADLEWPEKKLYQYALKRAAKFCRSLQVMGEYISTGIPSTQKKLENEKQ